MRRVNRHRHRLDAPRDQDRMTLGQLRRQIDRLDMRVLQLLNQRADLAVRVGQVKKRQDRPLFDPVRERQILRRMTHANHGPLTASAVQAIYREILRQIRRLERTA